MANEWVDCVVAERTKESIDVGLRPLAQEAFPGCSVETEDFRIRIIPPKGQFESTHNDISDRLFQMVKNFRLQNAVEP